MCCTASIETRSTSFALRFRHTGTRIQIHVSDYETLNIRTRIRLLGQGHFLNWPAYKQLKEICLYFSLTLLFSSFCSVETSDGKRHQEEGELKNAGTENEAMVVRGSYSYVGDDGQTYTVNYIADENGFQPEGAHLPKPQ